MEPQKSVDFDAFRSSVLQQKPNINTQQLKQLDTFILSKQSEQLARQRGFIPDDLAKTNPSAALRLSGEGIPFGDATGASGETPEGKRRREARVELLGVTKRARGIFEEFDKKGKDVTGFFPTFLFGTRKKFGLVTPEQTRARAAISDVASTFAFSVGGKQFTRTELDLIRGLLPEPSDNEGVIRDKLAQLEETLKSKSGVQTPTNTQPARQGQSRFTIERIE